MLDDELPFAGVEFCELSDELCDPFEELLSELCDESLDELPLPVVGVDDEFPELSLEPLFVFPAGVDEELSEPLGVVDDASPLCEPLVDGVVLVDEPLPVVDEPELEVSLLLVSELFVGTTGTCSVSPSLMLSASHVPADW